MAENKEQQTKKQAVKSDANVKPKSSVSSASLVHSDKIGNQLRLKLIQLQARLRKIDILIEHKLGSDQQVSLDVLSSWYLQHLLVMTIRAFAVNQEVTVPKYIGRWQFCFSKDDKAMMVLWRQLIVIPKADSKILQPQFEQLKEMLKTQMVPVEITDEVTQWRLRLKGNHINKKQN